MCFRDEKKTYESSYFGTEASKPDKKSVVTFFLWSPTIISQTVTLTDWQMAFFGKLTTSLHFFVIHLLRISGLTFRVPGFWGLEFATGIIHDCKDSVWKEGMAFYAARNSGEPWLMTTG